jgi:CheY-like chemotaxis protein
MYKTVLWIDDKEAELAAALRMVGGLERVRLITAQSSSQATKILRDESIDAIVTDILRRNPDGSIARDDGYEFFTQYLRPNWPVLPVIFHTKNLPNTFRIDPFAHYLSKWNSEAFKGIELESRLHAGVLLYEAYVDQGPWRRIEPRLVRVNRSLISRLERYTDIWQLNPSELEELAGEVLEKEGFDVLWIPGGSDHGIDIIAGSADYDFLIDVKHYRNSVGVELVRSVCAAATTIGYERAGRITHGGIITSSRFTREAETFRNMQRIRPLLRDGEWLRETLSKYLPSRTG